MKNLESKGMCYITDSGYITKVIKEQSEIFGIDASLIASIICQESRGNVWAMRYEPAFYNRYLSNKRADELKGFVPERIPTLQTETLCRATSWGLMQIMGETARENDYNKIFLSSLLLPENNIKMGCKILSGLFKREEGITDKRELLDRVLLGYNGGGNKEYPLQVRKWLVNKTYASILSIEV